MTLTCQDRTESSGVKLGLMAIFGIIVITIGYTFSNGISGNDFWWHVKVGEWIVEHGMVPTTDIFSWYGIENQIPWTAHEWLADVLLYGVHSLFGDVGIYILSIFAAFLMTWLLWREVRYYIQENILVAGLFFILFAVTTSVFFYGRPHLFSFFLLFFELKLLFGFYRDQNSKNIYLIPVISCVWSNLHGGSASLSYILCAVFFAVSTMNLQIGKIEAVRLKKKSIITLLIMTVLAVLGLLVNPIGFEVLLYPYKSFGDSLQMTLISEWRAPDAKNMGDLLLFYLPIVLLLLGFFSTNKLIRLIDLAIMGIFVLLFLRSVRFIMLWYIAAVFCSFPYMPHCGIKPVKRKQERLMRIICIVAVVILIFCITANIYETARAGELISVAMSSEVVRIVKQDDPKRLFNDYNLGETLIYHEIPVFFDARADLYAYDHLMADGVSMMFLEQANIDAPTAYVNVKNILDRYQYDAILILKCRPLYAYLISHPEQFESVYEDQHIGYFHVIS